MSISPQSSNITKSSNAIDLFQGESKDLDLFICQEVERVDGNIEEEPVNLTDATIQMTVRKKVGSPDIIISKNSSNALEIEILSPPEDGKAVIHINATDTQNVEPGKYVFDVWLQFVSGKKVPVIEVSEFKIKKPVTEDC